MTKYADIWLASQFADEIERQIKERKGDLNFQLDVLDVWLRYRKQGTAYLKQRRQRRAVAFVIHFLHVTKQHRDHEEDEMFESHVLRRLLLLCSQAMSGTSR